MKTRAQDPVFDFFDHAASRRSPIAGEPTSRTAPAATSLGLRVLPADQPFLLLLSHATRLRSRIFPPSQR
jgi:hypothetical protein